MWLVLLLGAIAGCSTEQTYKALQSMEQSRCVDQPANQYQDCLQQSDATYREYELARQDGER